jgi:hypothetical protein
MRLVWLTKPVDELESAVWKKFQGRIPHSTKRE